MMLHEIINTTNHPCQLGFCQNRDGADVAVVLVKVSYIFTERGGLVTEAEAERQCPIFLGDVFYDKPDNSSLRYASELTSEKLGTDVAVNGHAYAHGEPGKVKKIQAGLRVGDLTKVFDVCGFRIMHRFLGSNSAVGPKAFDKVPLRYEQALGGAFVDAKGVRRVHQHNPVGKGFVDPSQQDGWQLPSLGGYEKCEPAGLGFVPGFWRQRAQFAGTFDEAWKRDRYPLPPHDFDARFYNCVPQDQVVRGGLGNDAEAAIVLSHLHPRAAKVVLRIPARRIAARFRIRDREERSMMVADTLFIEPDEGRLAITYRSSCVLQEDIRYVRAVHVWAAENGETEVRKK